MFEPEDHEEHDKACKGEDVPDYCINCGQKFLAHTNGVCPEQED